MQAQPTPALRAAEAGWNGVWPATGSGPVPIAGRVAGHADEGGRRVDGRAAALVFFPRGGPSAASWIRPRTSGRVAGGVAASGERHEHRRLRYSRRRRVDRGQLTTKADLDALESRLTWRLVSLAAAIVAAVKLIPGLD